MFYASVASAQTVDIKETPGETTTAYLPFAGTAGKTYDVKVFRTDNAFAPTEAAASTQMTY